MSSFLKSLENQIDSAANLMDLVPLLQLINLDLIKTLLHQQIKQFDDNKLQNDWIANQAHHLPLFTHFNNILIKIFSIFASTISNGADVLYCL